MGLAFAAHDTPPVPDVARFPAEGKNRTALLSAQGMPRTWQERECLHVAGPDDREVPVVKRGDLGQPKALGDGRHGGIGDAKRKIKISLHEFGHAADAGALEPGDLEPVTAGGRRSPQACGPPRLEEIPDLAQDRRGRQQRAFRMPQEAEACLAGVIRSVAAASRTPASHSSTSAAEFRGEDLSRASGQVQIGANETKKGRSLFRS